MRHAADVLGVGTDSAGLDAKGATHDHQLAGFSSSDSGSGWFLYASRRPDLLGLVGPGEPRARDQQRCERRLTGSLKDWSQSLRRFRSPRRFRWPGHLCRASRADWRPMGSPAEPRAEDQQQCERLLPVCHARRRQTSLPQQPRRRSWSGRLLRRIPAEHRRRPRLGQRAANRRAEHGFR